MPKSPFNTPDSPPVGPVIPEGLTTKLSKIVLAASAVVLAVFSILEGDYSEEQIGALVTGLVTLVSLTQSRGKQAAAAYAAGDLTGRDDDLDGEIIDADPAQEKADIHDAEPG